MKKSKGKHSVDSVKRVVSIFQGVCAELDKLAEEMEKRRISSLTIDCQSALERALKDINRWRGAVFDAVMEAAQNFDQIYVLVIVPRWIS